MASVNASNWIRRMCLGEVHFSSPNTFKAMVLNAAYTPDKDNHSFRNSLTANEVAGTGYTAGGVAVTIASIAYNAVTDRVEVVFNDPEWANSSFAGQYLAIYRDTGNAATDDVVTILDNGSVITSSNSLWKFDITGPYYFQN